MFSILVASLAGSAAAEESSEERTVLFPGVETGGFGGLTSTITRVDGQGVVLAGMRAGVLIDHRFAFGLAGRGAVTDSYFFDRVDERTPFVELVEADLFASYAVLPEGLVHVAFDGLVGAGSVRSSGHAIPVGDGSVRRQAEGYLLGEVGASVVLNLTRYARAHLGSSWRFAHDMHSLPRRGLDLGGLAFTLGVDAGRF